MPNVSADLTIDYVEMYVDRLDEKVDFWVNGYGFTIVADYGSYEAGHRSVALRQGEIHLLLTEATGKDHPAYEYVRQHGDGVADIALRTANLAAYVELSGAAALSGPDENDGDGTPTLVLPGFGDVRHSVRQRPATATTSFAATDAAPSEEPTEELLRIDHFAICVGPGRLDEVVDHYRDVLGFDQIFEERISVGEQAMLSKVVQSASGAMTITIVQSDPDAKPGQVDEFIRKHGGEGVQHIAFLTSDVVHSVRELSSRGVAFLSTPASYYDLLAERLQPKNHDIDELRETMVLADEDHGGQLFQLFTRSVHPARTIFFELIERAGAETFGSSNIKALYEAVELQRQQAGDAP